jgi:hypothetical protein
MFTYQSVDGAGDGRVAGMKSAAAWGVENFVGQQDGRLHTRNGSWPRITGIVCNNNFIVSPNHCYVWPQRLSSLHFY